MRTSSLVALALAGAALLASAAASAVPIRVGLQDAGGSHSWRSDAIGDPSFVNLSAWQSNGNEGWNPAWMTNQQDNNAHDGLGVCGSEPSNDDGSYFCGNTDETNYIDSSQLQQMIDMNISEFDADVNGLTVTLLTNTPLGASYQLLGMTCTTPGDATTCTQQIILSDVQGACSATPPYAGMQSDTGVLFCTYDQDYLEDLGISDIWIMALNQCDGEFCSNSELLLGSGDEFGFILDTAVPEPGALGMFGLGTLLLGLFAGLRRRRTS